MASGSYQLVAASCGTTLVNSRDHLGSSKSLPNVQEMRTFKTHGNQGHLIVGTWPIQTCWKSWGIANTSTALRVAESARELPHHSAEPQMWGPGDLWIWWQDPWGLGTIGKPLRRFSKVRFKWRTHEDTRHWSNSNKPRLAKSRQVHVSIRSQQKWNVQHKTRGVFRHTNCKLGMALRIIDDIGLSSEQLGKSGQCRVVSSESPWRGHGDGIACAAKTYGSPGKILGGLSLGPLRVRTETWRPTSFGDVLLLLARLYLFVNVVLTETEACKTLVGVPYPFIYIYICRDWSTYKLRAHTLDWKGSTEWSVGNWIPFMQNQREWWSRGVLEDVSIGITM